MGDDFWRNLFKDETTRLRDEIQERELADAAAQGVQHRLDREQDRQIKELRVMVQVLGELLAERGLVDQAELKARVTAVLHPPPPAPQAAGRGGAPYRDAAGGTPAVREAERRCSRCLKYVAVSRLDILAEGEVCDRCLAAAG